MKLSSLLKLVLAPALASILMAGCNVGNAPAGMSAEEAKDHFNKSSPEDQIKMIEGSPAPAAEKKARIDEIKRKAGMPIDDAPIADPSGGLPPKKK